MKLMVLNCSGKAEISNSQYFTERLIECFKENKADVEYDIYYIAKQNRNEIIDKAADYDTILYVTPICAGTLSAFVLDFLQEFESRYTGDKNKNVYIIDNSGFYAFKGDTDIVSLKLWAEKVGFNWKGYFRISTGELMLIIKTKPKDKGPHKDMFIKMNEFSQKLYKGEYSELISYPVKFSRFTFQFLGFIFWFASRQRGYFKPKYLIGDHSVEK